MTGKKDLEPIPIDEYEKQERPFKRIEYESVDISDEEIARQLRERPGGRKAGRGDSPYSQEFYEEVNGLKEAKE